MGWRKEKVWKKKTNLFLKYEYVYLEFKKPQWSLKKLVLYNMDLSNFNLFFDANKSQCDNDSIGSDVQQLYNFWQCGICHEIFHDKKSELHHQTTAHSGMEHLCKCAICGLNFSDETSKNDHLKKYHLKSNIDDTVS